MEKGIHRGTSCTCDVAGCVSTVVTLATSLFVHVGVTEPLEVFDTGGRTGVSCEKGKTGVLVSLRLRETFSEEGNDVG